MTHAQKISSSIGQSDSVITFDLAIYMKAKQVQWRCQEEFSDTTSALMKGKCYNRGIRGHKLAMEAFFRLLWKAFKQWISDQIPDLEPIIRGELHDKIPECRVAVQNKRVGQENVKELALNMQEVVDLLERFKQDS